jgi:hypothetical protein
MDSERQVDLFRQTPRAWGGDTTEAYGTEAIIGAALRDARREVDRGEAFALHDNVHCSMVQMLHPYGNHRATVIATMARR